MKFAYVHTYIHTDKSQPWRVYECLLLRECVKRATLLFVDQFGSVQFIETEHYDCRDSAKYWVRAEEFDKMRESIEADWERRHCWREAYDDVQRIKASRDAHVANRD